VPESLLKTKLYIPPLRPDRVPRPRLIERLDQGLESGHRLSLISAPAGFGKTTLVSQWLAAGRRPSAWLSLEESENDPNRFYTYMVAAVSTVIPKFGQETLGMIQAPKPPVAETVLTTLINEINNAGQEFTLVLDDYHQLDARPIDEALAFALEHLPPQMHLAIVTREDPRLPLARLRSRAQLTELRATDLRFTAEEAAGFLNQVMGLNLSEEEIAALDNRTEGWIAGLQLAALAIQGARAQPRRSPDQASQEARRFIDSFTGTHRYILDYLIEEVLDRQPENIQRFLLQTSILDRLSGPLCDAVCFVPVESAGGNAIEVLPEELTRAGEGNSQAILDNLERANLFIVPLDNERRWYRYHHLFADLLRQRLQHESLRSGEDAGWDVSRLHIRASQWYEDSGLEVEAFRHAAAANDFMRAARLIEGKGMPLTFRGAIGPVLNWLESLPDDVMDEEPLLWVTYASTLLALGRAAGVEPKLKAAEAAIAAATAAGAEPDEKNRDLIGRIAATRATYAWGLKEPDTIIDYSQRALEYLSPDNLPFRTSTGWKLAYAYRLKGDRSTARKTYNETIAACEASGNTFINIMASLGLADIQLGDNELHQAAGTYRRILELIGNKPLMTAVGAYAGLAKITYEWNDLDAAQRHGQEALDLARHIESNDAFATCAVLLARLKLTQGDADGATVLLTEAESFLRRHNYLQSLPGVVDLQVVVLLHQVDLARAAALAGQHQLPKSQARVLLSQGDPAAAIALLDQPGQQAMVKGWKDEQLRITLLQAIARFMLGEMTEAQLLLAQALALAEPGGFIRTFLDEGPAVANLLTRMTGGPTWLQEYRARLLEAFGKQPPVLPARPRGASLVEPLSQRELEVLQLISDGLTNSEIAARLYLTLNTVKVHNRNIFGKLGVHNRAQAVIIARELDLLSG